jgi:uncharacterized protein (TIGR02300 family)
MVKPEWGLKRTCQSCETRFYDLQRVAWPCPKCGVAFENIASHRGRRSKQAAAEKEAKAKLAVVYETEPHDVLDSALLEDELLDTELPEDPLESE